MTGTARMYEVVGNKGKAGCDYNTASDIREAKLILGQMVKREPDYEMIFVRQYYRTPNGRDTYRVLHKLTWKPTSA